MFQENIKNEYLRQFENESTREVYKRIFVLSESMENRLGKDLFDFNEEELKAFIRRYLKPKTKQSARTYCNVLSNYIQWAIDKNICLHYINPIRRNQEYFYTFVENQNALYLSKEEVDSIVASLHNAQDQFLVQALFEGVQGKKLAEIRNLKIKDVLEAMDNDNNLILHDDDGSSRTVKVSRKLLNIARLAHGEMEYYKRNGEINRGALYSDYVSMPVSDYIVKPTATSVKLDVSKPVSQYTVYNRLEMIKSLEEFEEFHDALTSKNLVRSGMIHLAKQVFDEKGGLNRSDIEDICKHFNMNYKWSLRDFLNEETIKEVYGIVE